MSTDIKSLGSFVWSIAELLRGDFKQSEYGKVTLINGLRGPPAEAACPSRMYARRIVPQWAGQLCCGRGSHDFVSLPVSTEPNDDLNHQPIKLKQ
jgi:hypothetical protein